ncbi:hypothetical protein [Tepidibacter mesophilus]|nr:hypothetical protein [Tepidibacter mesophilus]
MNDTKSSNSFIQDLLGYIEKEDRNHSIFFFKSKSLKLHKKLIK